MSSSPSRCALLLQGINVGAHNRLAMADLRALLVSLGATDVVTYLQSGNAVLTADVDGLAERVQQALSDRHAVRSRAFSRSTDELHAVIAANPFPQAVAQPKNLHVAFVERALDLSSVAALGPQHGEDQIAIGDGALYLSYAATSHDSPLAGILRKLNGPFTARNWTTVTKVAALCAQR